MLTTLLPNLFIYFIVALIGLVVGSFLNVVIVRYPQMLMQAWQQQSIAYLELSANSLTTNPTFNLITPRSHCPYCKHTLYWYHNIPLLSYLWLRGRCYFCQHCISIQYPLVECLSLLITLVVFHHYGLNEQMLCACLLSWYLLTLAMIDLNSTLLPDVLTLSLLWLGLLISVIPVYISAQEAIIASALGYVILWIIAGLFNYIRQTVGMGHGDFKLVAALGAWVGVIPLINILAVAAFLGICINLILLLFKKIHYNQPIPFGPCLAISGWFILLYGPILTDQFNFIV